MRRIRPKTLNITRSHLNTKTFIEKAIDRHGIGMFDYSNTVYTGCHSKVKISCIAENHSFEQVATDHLRGAGCKKCVIAARGPLYESRKTTAEFIRDAKLVHGERYDYSLINYTSCLETIKIICKICGPFFQKAGEHLKRPGLCLCRGRARPIVCFSNYIKESNRKHNSRFDYSNSVYKGTSKEINIRCIEHDETFICIASDHLKGNGSCPSCKKKLREYTNLLQRKSFEQFVEDSNKQHRGRYIYNREKYNSVGKSTIKCSVHGEFEQTSQKHTAGSGCPKCSRNISNIQLQWLSNYSGIIHEYRIPSTLMKADGFDPNTNTIYQFHGDYWHGNPRRYSSESIHPVVNKSYGFLYQRTLENEERIKNLGYNLIVMWEDEFRATLKSPSNLSYHPLSSDQKS